MAGLVALIALIALIGFTARSFHRGDSWPMAILMGVKHALLGMIAIYGLLVMLAVGVGTVRAILHPVAEAMIALFPDTQPPASRAGQRLEAPSTEIPAAARQPLPTPTPRVVNAHAPRPHVRLTPISLAYEADESLPEEAGESPPQAVELPTRVPTSVPTPTPAPTRTPATLPTATPADSRSGCDPAYPDARTCIPPGPPWDQGCAITDERRFTALPPDPQGLDRDRDGIGCEPIS